MKSSRAKEVSAELVSWAQENPNAVISDIARRFGVAWTTAERYLKRAGDDVEKRKAVGRLMLPEDQRRAVLIWYMWSLAEEKLSTSAIGERVGLSKQRVSQILALYRAGTKVGHEDLKKHRTALEALNLTSKRAIKRFIREGTS